MSAPFDLDAVVVESDDAEPFRFTWGGKVFELPAIMQLPVADQLRLVDAASDFERFRLAFGEDLLAELSTTVGANGKPMTAARMLALGEAWVAYSGESPGKSPASPASSAPTAPRSKPTSRSTRARKTN